MIKEQLAYLKDSLPKHVQLVAVSKTKPNVSILTAYQEGQRIFGENRVQELADKFEVLPKDIEWHMIGHLQRNKVKIIAPFVALIHGVDSFRLLREINKQAVNQSRHQNVLLQFHIAQETSKFGFDLDEVRTMLKDSGFQTLKNISICGVMGMATFTSDQRQVREEFKHLKTIFDDLKSEEFSDQNNFKTVSMGMSGDYEIAIGQGSTMVRIGSSIFGSRD
jgi:PLP dependent protein